MISIDMLEITFYSGDERLTDQHHYFVGNDGVVYQRISNCMIADSSISYKVEFVVNN